MSARMERLPVVGATPEAGLQRLAWLMPLVPLLLAALLIASSPAQYALKVGVLVAVAALQALSLNIIWGYAGQFSMGQVALSAVGAYASALSVTKLGWNPWLSVLPALGVSIVFTLLFGALSLRLKGFYFSIVTLAFAQLISMVLYNADITGGPSGMTVPYTMPNIVLFGATLLRMDSAGYLVVSAAVLAVLLALTLAVSRRPLGRAIIAVREEETLARAIGIEPTRYKIIAFLMSSVPAALAGWLLAPFIAYLSPTGFGMEQLLDQICMVVIGGAGTVLGPVAGALVVVLIPELLRFAGALRMVGYSVVLILVVIFAREGLVGWVERRLRRRSTPQAAAPTPMAPMAAPPPAGNLPTRANANAAPLLRIQALTKRYFGVTAVSTVSFDLHAGEIVGLIGPNGAGKTTLFDMVSGFTVPTQGSVAWLDEMITAVPPHRRAQRGLVRTFQHARVFPRLTTRDNLLCATHLPARGLLGAQTEAERVARAMALCHLTEWADTTAQQLPYGVSKRLGVAMGLITEPQLLMLDEPAAGLTTAERQALLATLVRIGQLGLALLVIEHDVAFVTTICPRIVVLSAGEVIADGSVAAIRADAGVIEAYLGTPAASGGKPGGVRASS